MVRLAFEIGVESEFLPRLMMKKALVRSLDMDIRHYVRVPNRFYHREIDFPDCAVMICDISWGYQDLAVHGAKLPYL